MASSILLPMSARDIDRHHVVRQFIQRQITRKKAAQLLKLSERQVVRLKRCLIKRGAKGLIHGNRGHRSNHALSQRERDKIEYLLKTKYPDFKPTFAAEKLLELHKIDRDPKTIRSIMISAGMWSPKKRRAGEEHRSWRPRKECLGEMIQFDGSYHHWFEDRAEQTCLLAAIDDATGRVMKAEFVPHEGVFPVFGFWKDYVSTHGKPRLIYPDKFSTYKMNAAAAKENHELKTQFERAMKELGIEVICANSPQAKGRVERLFQTLQDRLVKELRLAGISTAPKANQFLKDVFIPKFNKQFAVVPVSSVDAHRSLTGEDKIHLDAIFSAQSVRTIQNDFTFSFKNQWYQLTKQQPVTICRKDKVIVEERLDGSISLRPKDRRGKYLTYEVLPERPKRAAGAVPWVIAATEKQPRALQSLKKPAADHSWRKSLVFRSQVKEPSLVHKR